MSALCTDKDAHQALDALLGGELDDPSLAKLRGHVATCESCREQYDRVTRVQAQLENSPSGLPQDRMAYLQQRVLDQSADANAQHHRASAEPVGARFWRWLLPTFGALTAAVVAFVVLKPDVVDDGYQARGGADDTFGVRAFCVAPGAPPQVKAEAGPGGTLSCPPGMAVTFAYSAPRAAQLHITAPRAAGEPLEFLAKDDPQANVRAGTDVPLTFSTPVSGDWLSAPVDVKATFVDPQSGQVLSESTVTLQP